MKQAKKRILIYNFNEIEVGPNLQIIYEVPANIEFFSHGRLFNDFIIFVEDHRKVKYLDIKTKRDYLLFTMDANVIAFDIFDTQEEEEKG